MSDILGPDAIKSELVTLLSAISERNKGEQKLEADYHGRTDDSETHAFTKLRTVGAETKEAQAAAQRDYDKSRQDSLNRFEAEYETARVEYQKILGQVDQDHETAIEAAEKEKADASWMVSSVLDDNSQDSPRFQYESFKKRLTTTKDKLKEKRAEMDQAHEAIVDLLQNRRQWQSFDDPEPVKPPEDLTECEERFEKAYTAICAGQKALAAQKLSRLFAGFVPFLLFFVFWGAISGAVIFFVNPALLKIEPLLKHPTWELTVAGVAAALVLIVQAILFGMSRSAGGDVYGEVHQAVAELKTAHRKWGECAKRDLHGRQKEYERRYADIVAQRDRALANIEARAEQKLADAAVRREKDRAETEQKYKSLMDGIVRKRDEHVRKLDEAHLAQMTELTSSGTQKTEAIKQKTARTRAEREANETRDRNAIATKWTADVSQFLQRAEGFRGVCQQSTPEWSTILSKQFAMPEAVRRPIRIGRYDVDFSQIPNGLSADKRFWPEPTRTDVPLLLPFPSGGSLLLECEGEGRNVAVDALRTVMLRLLNAVPAGKLRLTILDPAGLGEQFSAFMNLADFDELMVGTRIWTEKAQIEKRLNDLSEHMENIFQAYLRNEFKTIEEYNEQAGEVAEPYHFLVVANFPTNFSETAARRLVSIADKGPQCGVYTLVSVDTRQTYPHEFQISDLEDVSTTLKWNGEHFATDDRTLELFPAVFDEPPQAGEFADIVKTIGRLSKGARRVEVPFDRIAPRDKKYWTLTSRAELDVPLGRAGATKLQNLHLGRGTSQHVMIAGKTGSGKSSLLHTIITNMALNYSPDEVQFFLVDFKKGVEFKAYASHHLPHAQIIGIESDREFGISVLERLDTALKDRGELFRKQGVQDINGFRKSAPDVVMPRILLIIDEFQEFFVEDDSLSQAANLLLDRLVRQGRAFGIHVVLGSQTLGGAYSLARSTLGQIAVRIALQCSESDAHLILSEENTAARLLTRPGEAIYNDANGMSEGNHTFQVAWLPDDRRESFLRDLQERTQAEHLRVVPPIVFEGNVASDPRNNKEIVQSIEAFCRQNGDGAVVRNALSLWLGEAVSIREPTRITLTDRPGDNMLIVGQDAISAQGMLAVSFFLLASQQRVVSGDNSPTAQFYVFDGQAEATNEDTEWKRLVRLLPHAVIRAGQRDAAATIEQVAAEVTRRVEEGSTGDPTIILCISNLSRFRTLRNEDDDFGFGSMDSSKPPSAGKLLANILKDGPAVGVHSIVWCDSYSNLSRWITSQTLREFEIRVTFQMNANDSSSLIDSPAAARLGTNRAFLYLRETGKIEKIRPYAIPSDDWLTWIADQFKKKAEPAIESTP